MQSTSKIFGAANDFIYTVSYYRKQSKYRYLYYNASLNYCFVSNTTPLYYGDAAELIHTKNF